MTTIHEQLMFLLAEIELPDRAHDVALKRYQDVCELLSRPQSRLVDFDAVVDMLAEGLSTRRGRRSAHLHFDRVHGRLRPRRGARRRR